MMYLIFMLRSGAMWHQDITCRTFYACSAIYQRSLQKRKFIHWHCFSGLLCLLHSPKGYIPMFISAYVLNQSLCSPVSIVPEPMLPSTFIPQSGCSPSRYSLYFQVPIFVYPFNPSPDVLQRSFIVLIFPLSFLSPYAKFTSLCFI